MRRVVVIGSGGAGKSTFAAGLGRRAGLPVVHLDAVFWRPGWVPTPADEWRAAVAALVARPAWVLDGNYGGTLALRLVACDTAVFLDLPRRACLARVLGRWWRHRGCARPDMCPGCPGRTSGEFLWWVWTHPAERRPGAAAVAGAAAPARARRPDPPE